MGRFHLSGVTLPIDNGSALLLISVADDSGAGVEGLEAGNFDVTSANVDSSNSFLQFVQVGVASVEGRGHGVYMLALDPGAVLSTLHGRGDHALAIRVHRNVHEGPRFLRIDQGQIILSA